MTCISNNHQPDALAAPGQHQLKEIMTTEKTKNHRSRHCPICLGDCPTPRACEVPDENWFDRVMDAVVNMLAGVGLVSLVIFVCFVLGRTA